MKTKFQLWKEQADMPEYVDGRWVDLETGLHFDNDQDYGYSAQKKPRASLSKNAQTDRFTAKVFGGKALTGSAKQKEWAEKIRAEKLATMTEDQAIACCNPNGILRTAHVWISNRSKSGADFADFVEKQSKLLATCKKARESRMVEEYERLAAEYNALTTAWGFE